MAVGVGATEDEVAAEVGVPMEEVEPVADVPLADLLPAVAPPPRTPAPTSPEDLVAGPAWSTTALLHLGLPLDLVRSIDLDGSDEDIAWTMALATVLAPLCGAIPAGPPLLVGPHADGVSCVKPMSTVTTTPDLRVVRPHRTGCGGRMSSAKPPERAVILATRSGGRHAQRLHPHHRR